MKIEVIDGRETVASWVKRNFETVTPEENVVAWWKSQTHYGTNLQPEHVHAILSECHRFELKKLRSYLEEKVETSQFLKPQHQRELNAVNDYCRSEYINL